MSLTEETAFQDSVLDFIDSEAEAIARDKAHAAAKESGWLDKWNDWRAHCREVAEGVVS